MADGKSDPLDITAWFVGQLLQNGRVAEKKGSVSLVDVLVGGPLVSAVSLLTWFKRQVQSGGPWDFKSNFLKQYRNAGVVFNGKKYRYDMPGNFHYGFVGAAAGIRTWLLKYAAGQAQLKSGTSKKEFHCTDFDDPEDQAYIELGIQLYDNIGLKVTGADVANLLAKFKPKTCGTLTGWEDAIAEATVNEYT
jgi:hypothetical protein